MSETSRQIQFEHWLHTLLAQREERLLAAPELLAADASSRRFIRVRTQAGPRVAVDAPPERENTPGFLRVATWLEAWGLAAPRLLAADTEAGFLFVTDLGDATLARQLDTHPAAADTLYEAAIDALLAFQVAGAQTLDTLAPDKTATNPFPRYDAARLQRENSLFGQWCLEGLLGLPHTPAVLTDAITALTSMHLAAPRVAVHLDWHSRNLMVTDTGTIAMVDFQDACVGPQGYDLVSLLRDCYRTLDTLRLERLLTRFLTGIQTYKLPGSDDLPGFRRTFELVGVQRHLKALGIFARLYLRDGRDHTLSDMPRTLDHILQVAPRHTETAPLGDWLGREVRPRLARYTRDH